MGLKSTVDKIKTKRHADIVVELIYLLKLPADLIHLKK